MRCSLSVASRNKIREYKPIYEGYDPVKIEQSGVRRNGFRIQLDDDDIAACFQAAKDENNWSSTKPGVYGQGLEKNGLGILMGYAVECCFAKAYQLPFRWGYVEYGEDWDFELMNKTLDTKGSSRFYPKGLVMYSNLRGPRRLKADLYMFGYLEKPVKAMSDNICSCVLHSVATRNFVEGCSVRRGRHKKADHKNYEVPFGHTEVKDALWHLELWRERKTKS